MTGATVGTNFNPTSPHKRRSYLPLLYFVSIVYFINPGGYRPHHEMGPDTQMNDAMICVECPLVCCCRLLSGKPFHGGARWVWDGLRLRNGPT